MYSVTTWDGQMAINKRGLSTVEECRAWAESMYAVGYVVWDDSADNIDDLCTPIVHWGVQWW